MDTDAKKIIEAAMMRYLREAKWLITRAAADGIHLTILNTLSDSQKYSNAIILATHLQSRAQFRTTANTEFDYDFINPEVPNGAGVFAIIKAGLEEGHSDEVIVAIISDLGHSVTPATVQLMRRAKAQRIVVLAEADSAHEDFMQAVKNGVVADVEVQESGTASKS